MSRYSDYKHAKKILKDIEKNPGNYLIIHYSCESFHNLGGKSPRIASISVRRYGNAQTNNFSIHQYADILHEECVTDENYKNIEKKLLQDFYQYVEKNTDKKWVHWNMRDSNFGFQALEQRFQVLGGTPIFIDNEKKIDLAYLFKLLYGGNYIDNPHIENLASLNNLTPNQFLNGKDEAEAFENHEYNKLSLSTSCKVNLFSNFLKSAINGSLKTNIPKWKIRGTSFSGLYATFSNSILGKTFNFLLSAIIGAIISKIVEGIF